MTGHAILLHHARVPPGLDESLQQRWLAVLPPRLAERISRMRQMRDRAATLLGIALLLDCAVSAGLAPPAPRSLMFPSRGKPCWPSGPDFSIAHTTIRAACALAPAGLGVGLDLEQRGSAARADLRLVASACEHELYIAAGLEPEDLWTAKEAALKAAGASAKFAPQVMLAVDSAEFRASRYILMRPRLARDCSCALAITQPAAISLREVDAGRLLESVA
jgi:phosphopantetheinyl transferase